MPLTVSHALSATTPDDPQYEIRPSHWNSAHVVTLNAAGSEISGAFSNAGNVTFGLETNGYITASANAAGAGDGFNRLAAGSQTAGTNNTIVFANSNGVTFGMSGSTQITASHNGITQQSTQPVAFNAGAVSSAFSTLVFQDSNGVSWSNNAGSIRASVRTDYLTTARASNDAIGLNTALTAGPLALTVNSSGLSLNAGSAAGTTSGFAGNLISGSMTHNTAGLNLSLNHPAWLTTAAQSDHSHGNPTLALTNLSGTTASNSAGLTLSLSAAAPGAGAGFTGGVSDIGNTSGQTGTQTGSFVLAGGNNITLSVATAAGGHQTITISGANVAAGNITVSAGTTSGGLGAVTFNDSNGVSFGLNAGVITATVKTDYLTSQSGQAFSADASSTFQTLSFQNSNGVSFSNNLGALRVTHDLQYTSATSAITSNALHSSASRVINIVAATNNTGGGTASASGNVSFTNANGATFYTSAGPAVALSYTVPSVTQFFSATNTTFNGTNVSGSLTLNTNGLRIDLSAGAGGAFSAGASNLGNTAGSTGVTGSRLVFVGTNNITLSQTTDANGATLSIRGPDLLSAGVANAGNTSGNTGFVTGQFNLQGGNNITLSGSTNGGSMSVTVSAANQSAQTLGLYASSQTTAQSSSSTVDARSLTIVGQGNISVGLSAGSFIISQTGGAGASPAASASNGSFTFQTLNFSNANNVTFGTSAGGIVTASVAAPGAAAENNNINLLGANTAGNTTASGSTIGLSGINLTLSGTNGSVVNISAPATSSLVGVSGISLSSNGSTVSVYQQAIPVHGWGNYSDGEHLTVVNGQNTILFQPMFVPAHIAFSEAVFPINYTNASNSSNSCTLTMHVGIYTRNASSLSLFTSTSSSYATTNSGTAGNMSLWLGKRNVPIGFTSSLTPGQYWLALRSQTTTGGGAGMSFSNYHFSNQNTVLSGRLGVGNNASDAFMPGMGSYSATSTAMPGSVAFTEIRGSAAANLCGIAYYFGGANV